MDDITITRDEAKKILDLISWQADNNFDARVLTEDIENRLGYRSPGPGQLSLFDSP